ncbi:hypothetical protein GPZ88_09875 (plasmid) [Streptococcus ruminicola]|uniref:XRE family transcriptional regulator n=2 Tax=Streptococcus TaxID=1301 RepID=A0A6G8I349_9STRE|nr:hypothetical protein [Streptococcus ruminicola]QIM47451.1 hypothetical protein GPZ88_09875 [Streptococcus ruminicola]
MNRLEWLILMLEEKNIDLKQLGGRMRHIRLNSHFAVAHLSFMYDIPITTIIDYESGKVFPPKKAFKAMSSLSKGRYRSLDDILNSFSKDA